MDRDGGTEARILQAATEVFLNKGRDGARMQEIAEKAGINKALLHYYFRSKDRLYEEVFRKECGAYIGSFLASVPETEDMEVFLRFFIDHYIDRLAQRPQVVSFVLWEIQQGGERFGRIIREFLFREENDARPFIVDIVARAVASGRIRKVDPIQFILSLLGVCVYPFVARPILERIVDGLDVLSEAFLEKRKEEVFRLFWEGIQHEG